MSVACGGREGFEDRLIAQGVTAPVTAMDGSREQGMTSVAHELCFDVVGSTLLNSASKPGCTHIVCEEQLRQTLVVHNDNTHVGCQLLHKGEVDEGVIGPHADTQAGHIGYRPQQAAHDATGGQPVHLAGVALRTAVLLPALQVKHLRVCVCVWESSGS